MPDGPGLGSGPGPDPQRVELQREHMKEVEEVKSPE